jgi:hypothetical protein
MRVSWATGLPSAARDIQVVSSARISRVNIAGGFAVAIRGLECVAGGLTSGWGEVVGLALPVAMGEVTGDSGFAEGVDAAGAGGVGDSRFAGGGVVGSEIGDGDDVPVARFFSGDACPTVRESLEGDGVAAAGAEAGD